MVMGRYLNVIQIVDYLYTVIMDLLLLNRKCNVKICSLTQIFFQRI